MRKTATTPIPTSSPAFPSAHPTLSQEDGANPAVLRRQRSVDLDVSQEPVDLGAMGPLEYRDGLLVVLSTLGVRRPMVASRVTEGVAQRLIRRHESSAMARMTADLENLVVPRTLREVYGRTANQVLVQGGPRTSTRCAIPGTPPVSLARPPRSTMDS